MEDFNEKKKAYFEKLRNNEDILSAMMAKEENSVETMSLIIDPQDETELVIADGIITFFGDTIKIFTEYCSRDFEEPDYSSILIMKFFVRVINALRSGNKEELEAIRAEISNAPTPETVAEMMYELLHCMSTDPESMGEYIFEECGFEDDQLSILQFQLYFKKANEFINSCMPSVQSQNMEDLKNPKNISDFQRFVDKFHSLYQRDYENENNLGK